MGKSGRVTLRDLRRAFRLLDECRDVGHDPESWPSVLADGLVRLVGARVGTVADLDVSSPGLPQVALLAAHGWEREEGPRFRRVVMEDRVYLRIPSYRKLMAITGRIVTRTREQLIGDAEYYRSWEYNYLNRRFGVDAQIASILYSGEPLRPQIFMLLRAAGEPLFRPCERRLLRIFHDEFGRHYGRTLASRTRSPFEGFPPRLRQTLRCLLEGDGEKQVAARLGLSRHTVHGYVADLYRRLDVSSRAELMAYCLRRRISPDEVAPPP